MLNSFPWDAKPAGNLSQQMAMEYSARNEGQTPHSWISALPD